MELLTSSLARVWPCTSSLPPSTKAVRVASSSFLMSAITDLKAPPSLGPKVLWSGSALKVTP